MTDTISSDDGAQWPVLDQPADRKYGGMLGWLSSASRTAAMTAAVSVVLVGGVTTAAVRNFAPGADPLRVVPASAFAVAQIDLSLPGGQDTATTHLVRRFPGALPGSGSIRDRLLRAVFKASSDSHVDYEKSVKPWLGDHVAVAGWTDSSGAPQDEMVLESTNDAAARKALREAKADGLAFSHGFAIIASSQQAADAAVRAADKSSLADSSTYQGDIASLSGTPVITGWLDGPAMVKAIQHAMTGQDGQPSPFLTSGFEGVTGRVVAGLRVSDEGSNSVVQLDVVNRGSKASTRATSTDRLRHLPSTTIAAVAVADPAGVVRDGVNAIKGPLGLFFGGFSGGVSCTASSSDPVGQCEGDPPPPDVDPLAAISSELGIQIPADLVSLLGSDAVVAYGGLSATAVPKIGLRSKPADVTAAADVVTKLRNRFGDTGVELSEQVAGSDFVLATTEDYAQDLAGSGTLGAEDRFAAALRGMPPSVQFAVYADLSATLPLVTHGAAPQLDHLSAFGWWSANVHGQQTTQLRLIVH
ncbi:MAG: hypothetical protein QOC82_2574 [Frankiaceae bacterium]|jgi:hypothetical protein|nr:hypothetical protein [Frankiaceae bacterium]